MKEDPAGSPDRAPDCLSCRFFRVTWDPAFPRSCEVFGFKTRQLPAMEVFAATGRHCPAFERRVPKPQADPGSSASVEGDIEDTGLWA